MPCRLTSLLLVGVLFACSTSVNPTTGRREVVMMSAEDEREIDEEAHLQIQAREGLVSDERIVGYVQEIGQSLVPYSPRQDVEYSFHIVEYEEPNAFALPGGHVYLSRGLIVLANTEAELAHVLGHEIGHVAARHAATRDAHLKTFGLSTLLSNVMSGGAQETHESERASAHPVARYQRDQERQADRVGQDIAARAGIEPTGMARFLTSLDNFTKLTQGFSMPQTYFATHPATRERMAEAAARAQSEAWKEAGSDRGNGPHLPYTDARDTYLDRIEGMAVQRPASEGVMVDDRFVHVDLGFSLRFPYGWKVRNEPAQLLAISPKGDAVAILQLQGPGTDPQAAAREYAEEEKLRLQRGTPVRLGELYAFRALTMLRTPTGPLNAEITWVSHGGRIYRLVGGMRAGQVSKYQGLFRKYVQSFRPTTEADAAKVRELHLRTARARSGETLLELSARTGNQWDPTYTSVVNNVFAHDALAEGQRIKIAVWEAYEAQPVPPPEAEVPDAESPETEAPETEEG